MIGLKIENHHHKPKTDPETGRLNLQSSGLLSKYNFFLARQQMKHIVTNALKRRAVDIDRSEDRFVDILIKNAEQLTPDEIIMDALNVLIGGLHTTANCRKM